MRACATPFDRRHPMTGLASFFVLALALASCGDGDDDDDGNPLGASGQATAANLAAAFERLRPRLAEALAAFEQIDPPHEWTDLHGRIRELIRLRLEAFDALLEGFESEDLDLYALTEQNLRQANDLIPGLNEELMEIDLRLTPASEATVNGKPTVIEFPMLSSE